MAARRACTGRRNALIGFAFGPGAPCDRIPLDPKTLKVQYLIRGQGVISAPLGFDAEGRAAAAFEDKTVLGFGRLP